MFPCSTLKIQAISTRVVHRWQSKFFSPGRALATDGNQNLKNLQKTFQTHNDHCELIYGPPLTIHELPLAINGPRPWMESRGHSKSSNTHISIQKRKVR